MRPHSRTSAHSPNNVARDGHMIIAPDVPRDIGAGKESHAGAENIRNRFPLQTGHIGIVYCALFMDA